MSLHNPGGIKGAVKPVACTITNGGFETGDLTEWIRYCFNYDCTQSVKTGGAFTGTHYGYLYGYRYRLGQSYGRSQIRNILGCNANNQKLHIAYRAGGDTDPTLNPCHLWVQVGGVNVVEYNLPFTATWTELEFNLSGGSESENTNVVFFIGDLEYQKNAWIDIDDVYFYC